MKKNFAFWAKFAVVLAHGGHSVGDDDGRAPVGIPP
jgi:hypothetical protein